MVISPGRNEFWRNKWNEMAYHSWKPPIMARTVFYTHTRRLPKTPPPCRIPLRRAPRESSCVLVHGLESLQTVRYRLFQLEWEIAVRDLLERVGHAMPCRAVGLVSVSFRPRRSLEPSFGMFPPKRFRVGLQQYTMTFVLLRMEWIPFDSIPLFLSRCDGILRGHPFLRQRLGPWPPPPGLRGRAPRR